MTTEEFEKMTGVKSPGSGNPVIYPKTDPKLLKEIKKYEDRKKGTK